MPFLKRHPVSYLWRFVNQLWMTPCLIPDSELEKIASEIACYAMTDLPLVRPQPCCVCYPETGAALPLQKPSLVSLRFIENGGTAYYPYLN